MLLRHPADWRSLVWVALMGLFASAQLASHAVPSLLPATCYLALSAGVIAHNHNHCPIFKSRRLNNLLGYCLSIFYGYPTFAWIPTHNLNHHKFVNRTGDATITWRYGNKNSLLIASTYFFVSSYFQSDVIKAYIRNARSTNSRHFRLIVTQYIVWAGAHALLMSIACVRFGFWRGIAAWAIIFGCPALFALWTIMLFNFIQHVHTDPWSEHNHSRTFIGRVLNFFLFNNGFHTAHHETPGAHWSTLPDLHAQIERGIEPELRSRSFAWWCFRNYFLGSLSERRRTRQVGRAPFDPPPRPERIRQRAEVRLVAGAIAAQSTDLA
jgi:beta-carotene hydroxylase